MTCMGGGKGKKTLIQDEKLVFPKMLEYETDQLKRNSTASFAKSTITDTKQTITDAKPAVKH